MQFYFIRHAQSENNQLWAETGSADGRSEDPDLTPLGRQQAERLAELLKRPGGRSSLPPEYDGQNVTGFHFTHLYCSLMVRSVSTGMFVARALGLPLVAWEEAHEVGGIHLVDKKTGEQVGLPGKNRAYFLTHYPELVLSEQLGEAGWWNRPYETEEQRSPRARRFLQSLLERHGETGDRVALVSHGGFFNHLLQIILGLPANAGIWFSINNASITRVDFVEGGIWLQYLNRIDFMPGEMIT